MNKKTYFLISLFIVIAITIKYFDIGPFNAPFFNYFSHLYSSGMNLKMAANSGNLETVNSIVNNHKTMQSISPWELGMAISFAAFMADSQKSQNNPELTERFNKIIQIILDSGYPIDNDYLGKILVYSCQYNDLNIVKAVLNNPYAKYIDKSFKIAIFLQAYMGNSTPMPSSFLQKSLENAIKNNNKEIVSELLYNPVLKNRFPENLEESASVLLAK